MNSLLRSTLAILCLCIYSSCTDHHVNEDPAYDHSSVNQTVSRSTNPDPFYDHTYVYDSLNIQSGRAGTYLFVDELMAFLQNNDRSGSLYDNLRSRNIYPCWYCSESEIIDFPNYYIPFYHLGTAELEGLLIAHRIDGERSIYYLAKSVVDFIVAQRIEPYSGYWDGIMQYFDLSTYPDHREDAFSGTRTACLVYNAQGSCGCPFINHQGKPDWWYCVTDDFTSDPCDVARCSLTGNGGAGSGEEKIDFHVFSNWTGGDNNGDEDNAGANATNSTGGGGNTGGGNNSPPRDDWYDTCDSYDGSYDVGTQIEPNGEIVIDEATGTIAIDVPENLYFNQVTKFISDYGLPYTTQELMQLAGEKCAVSNVTQVRNCLKCLFISPLGLTSAKSWALADDFDIIADCMASSDPDCVECKISLHEMKLPDGNLLSSAQRSLIENNVDCDHFDCLLDNRGLLERVLNYAEMEENAPNCTPTDDLNQILNTMEGCGNTAFTAALNAYFGVTWEPTQQVQQPTLPVGSTLCAGIFDIQDVGDGIHSVGAISGLRFDVVNIMGQTQTLTFDHLVLWADSDVNGADCPVSSIANLMAQAVNQTIADIRVRMGLLTDYSQIPNGENFHETIKLRIKELSNSCVGHGNGGSSHANTTNNPAAETAYCNASFVQLANNHISMQNGADCQ